eukprot:scaffold115772_cov18-Tisochrysis_lutea.AAC.1
MIALTPHPPHPPQPPTKADASTKIKSFYTCIVADPATWHGYRVCPFASRAPQAKRHANIYRPPEDAGVADDTVFMHHLSV